MIFINAISSIKAIAKVSSSSDKSLQNDFNFSINFFILVSFFNFAKISSPFLGGWGLCTTTNIFF
nr:MAG TPA: hypothetical protein [Caudoviricetes sp.]